MLKGICKKCGKESYGWSLNNPKVSICCNEKMIIQDESEYNKLERNKDNSEVSKKRLS